MSGIPTIAEAAKQIAAKQLSPVELTRACFDRVHALDGELRCQALKDRLQHLPEPFWTLAAVPRRSLPRAQKHAPQPCIRLVRSGPEP